MTQEIDSVKPALTVILDDGDFIINSTGAIGKAMSQAVLPLAASAKKVTIIADGEMKVMKRNATAENSATPVPPTRRPASPIPPAPAAAAGLDIQDQFAADLEAGVTGEQAMGETPVPTPGPSDPVAIPAGKRRRPQIFQDAAAPPAPELAEAEMDRLLQEAQQAEQDAAKVQEDRRFQAQQAVQANQEPAEETPAQPRRRERNLNTTNSACGRCGGNGQVMGDAGFTGACPVCLGVGKIKSWGRTQKVR